MREFQERRVLRKVIFSKFTFIFLTAVLIFLIYSAAKIYLRSRDAREANRLVEQEIESLKAKKTELEASVNRLQTETGAEEEIRNKFPVQKPGEQTVVIVNQENKNNPSANSSPSGFFPKIWQFIKNIF